MHIGLHVKYRYSSRILIKLEFSRQISNNPQIQNFIKIHPVGFRCSKQKRWTHMHNEANSRLSKFCERAKKRCKKLMPSLTYVKQCQVPWSISIAVMDKREKIRTEICESTSTACVPASWLSKCNRTADNRGVTLT
jgi:hypothetical protein